MAAGGWAMGGDFSLADCAAAPALYYGNLVEPLGEFRNVSAYLERLKARPSFARVLREAEPYFQFSRRKQRPLWRNDLKKANPTWSAAFLPLTAPTIARVSRIP